MHDHPTGFLWPFFWALFALVFWAVPMIMRHRILMKALDTARSLSEKGAAVPEEVMAALKPPRRPPASPERDLRTGVIMIAIALALAIFATILRYDGPSGHAVFPLYGIAAFPALLGLVHVGFWFFGRSRPRSDLN